MVGNQNNKNTLLICACCSQPFAAGTPLKKMDLYEVFVSIAGLPLCFVLKQQFDPNMLPQLLNGRKVSSRQLPAVIRDPAESHEPHVGQTDAKALID